MSETFSSEAPGGLREGEIGAVPAPGGLRSSEPRVGDSVGSYRLIRLLGQGTTGRVFEVEHDKLGHHAAMKLLVGSQAGRPAARSRLFAEALSVNRISNRHIVEVTDVVETGQHQALVMELLDGESLATAMSMSTSTLSQGMSLGPGRVLLILAQMCEALAAAHAAGFIHRDLKPENVFLCQSQDGSDLVKLLDFGVATSIDGRSSTSNRPSGPFVGTPAYVSPEQASGGAVTPATDIYSVGVILFELLSGRLPFEGWSLGEFLIQHLSAPVPRLPDEIRATPLGRTLDAIVQRCMDKQPEARFTSAAELAGIFATLSRGEAVSVALPVVPGRRRWPIGGKLALGLGALGALAVAVGLAGRPARRASRVAGAQASWSPASAVAAVVTIAFESEPAGAEARLAASGELLGLTPFRRAFPRRDQSLIVELRRAGFEPLRVAVSTASGRTVNATLAPTKASGRAPATRTVPARRLGVEKTIDPFRR
jgi:hypothetical protein